jgi:hypothetical protein
VAELHCVVSAAGELGGEVKESRGRGVCLPRLHPPGRPGRVCVCRDKAAKGSMERPVVDGAGHDAGKPTSEEGGVVTLPIYRFRDP